MGWFLEEVEGKRASEILLREAGGLASRKILGDPELSLP
jgi:hypothetical protein